MWSTTWFLEIIARCLSACGHNPNIVQAVFCYPEQADALTQSPLIKHITFIGSENVGRKVRYIANNMECFLIYLFFLGFLKVAMAATKHLTPVTLELGGKDPAVILPGTDLEQWASVWMRGV